MSDYTDQRVSDLIVNKLTLAKYTELKNAGSLQTDQLYQITDLDILDDMTGADGTNAGKHGLVPAPAASANGKYLRGDGTWQTPTNTKNTAGSTDTSSKIFLIGATSQAASPQTYSHDTAFVDTNGRLNSAAPATDANDTTVATTKWVKDQGYSSGTTAAAWGSITGTLSNQTDLQNALNAKANDSDVVKLTGAQSIADTKTFTGQVNIRTLLMKAENASTTEGGQISFESGAQEANAGKSMYIDRHNGIFRFVGVNSSGTTRLPLQVDIQNNRVFGVTPVTSDNSTNLATTAFVKNQGYIGSTNLATCHVVVETYINGTDWYRAYDDGWVEQGGQNNTVGIGTVVTITLLREFQDTSYFVTRTSLLGTSSGGNSSYLSGILNRTASTFQYRIDQTAYTTGTIWYACGYGA